MQISGSIKCWRSTSTTAWLALIRLGAALVEAHVLEVDGLVVDAAPGRSDPVGEASRLGDAAHERRDEGAVALRRQPLEMPVRPVGLAHDVAVGIDPRRRERADPAVERLVRRLESKRHAALLDELVPALDARDRVLHVVVAQLLVER